MRQFLWGRVIRTVLVERPVGKITHGRPLGRETTLHLFFNDWIEWL
jgi:hypothetical protein